MYTDDLAGYDVPDDLPRQLGTSFYFLVFVLPAVVVLATGFVIWVNLGFNPYLLHVPDWIEVFFVLSLVGVVKSLTFIATGLRLRKVHDRNSLLAAIVLPPVLGPLLTLAVGAWSASFGPHLGEDAMLIAVPEGLVAAFISLGLLFSRKAWAYCH